MTRSYPGTLREGRAGSNMNDLEQQQNEDSDTKDKKDINEEVRENGERDPESVKVV